MADKQNIHIAGNADGVSATLTVPGPSFTLNAADIDNFIAALAAVRGSLRPAFTEQPLENQEYQAITEPRFWVMPNQVLGGANLGLRHPGLGWLWFCLPHLETAQLSGLLQSHNASPPMAGSTAIN